MSPKKFAKRYELILEFVKNCERKRSDKNNPWVEDYLRHPLQKILTERRKSFVSNTLIVVANNALTFALSPVINEQQAQKEAVRVAGLCIDTLMWINED